MTLKVLHQIFLNSSGVCTDSRELVADQIFFALKGENFDGNRYVEQALSLGCILVVSDDPMLKGKEKVFVVESVLDILQSLANYHRKQKDVTVLAITGSNGKTTTKELIASVLSTKYSTLYTEGNLNNHIGLPLTLLRLKDEKLAVIEMGANHPGEIALLCNIAEPDMGIITNIGKAHLEGFGSMEGVRKAKGELYDYLTLKQKPILLNTDDRVLQEMADERGLSGVGYGMEAGTQVLGTIRVTKPFIKGNVSIGGEEYSLSTHMPGAYNFVNMLAAIAAGVHFEIEPEKMVGVLSDYRPDNNRSQIAEGISNTLLLDAYNANPSSMKISLEDFVSGDGHKKMVILGEMLELGEESEAEHRLILDWLIKSKIDKAMLIGEHFVELSESGNYPFLFFSDIQGCMDYLSDNKPSGYQILLKGSRKNALEQATNLLLGC
jgi:UDP-N-acetylmuramoyl-tripeptide--D-alanyl-D-alanine ligase